MGPSPNLVNPGNHCGLGLETCILINKYKVYYSLSMVGQRQRTWVCLLDGPGQNPSSLTSQLYPCCTSLLCTMLLLALIFSLAPLYVTVYLLKLSQIVSCYPLFLNKEKPLSVYYYPHLPNSPCLLNVCRAVIQLAFILSLLVTSYPTYLPSSVS